MALSREQKTLFSPVKIFISDTYQFATNICWNQNIQVVNKKTGARSCLHRFLIINILLSVYNLAFAMAR